MMENRKKELNKHMENEEVKEFLKMKRQKV